MDFSILSRHDDILASYFLDNLYLWFKTVRMNSDTIYVTGEQQMAIEEIRQIVNRPGAQEKSIKTGIKAFLQFPHFKEYVSQLSTKEATYFNQHLRRYLYMFSHQAGFEVSSTDRYTGTREACILATRDWEAGEVVQCCAGAITELTKEDDAKLKSEGRDFSVMVSTRRKCTCLFLGPARFMNHDCDANCEFMLEGLNSITFRVQKNIKCGEEMTVYYADHYFGIDNCECRCMSCERLQEGSFYVEKSDSDMTEKNDASTPETPPEDENTSVRRSGRTKKEVDYQYKLPPSPTKRARQPSKKAAGNSNIPLHNITNGKPLEESIGNMTIDDDFHHAKKHKPIEMGIQFICSPEVNHWVSMPADHDCRYYTNNMKEFEVLFNAQAEVKQYQDGPPVECIHLPRPPLKSQKNNRYHPPGKEHTFAPGLDTEITEICEWLDELSDISDSEGSIIADLNVATCCEAAKDYNTVITSKGREFCSRCYRHYKIYGLEWPTRKNPNPNPIPQPLPQPNVTVPIISFTSASSASSTISFPLRAIASNKP